MKDELTELIDKYEKGELSLMEANRMWRLMDNKETGYEGKWYK